MYVCIPCPESATFLVLAMSFDSPGGELVLSGSLEKAQERKADALIARARLSKHHRLLDIGFGWGGISIRLVVVGLLSPSLCVVFVNLFPLLQVLN